MSRENVEIAQATFDAWNAQDMDAYRELLDPDVIMRAPEGWIEQGPFIGRDAVMRQLLQLRETWDSDTLNPISDFAAAGDRVAVRSIWHGIGRGPESSIEVTWYFTVRRGKIWNIDYFWDHAEALEAVGLGRAQVL